ncbi:MAG TPA: class I SAM-dependent rRNA methyltransferase [Vicinamibacterales bacterium]|nr:class I SAM-dependent rRNA methyltransferase [Vicinamibacterales bacterium]
MPTVTVNKRGEDRIHSGHPWVYRSDVAEVRAEAGEIVRVSGPRGRVLGDALFSDRSEITVRMLTRGDVRADNDLLRQRLEQAIRFRESLGIDATAYRLVHGEADLLPSLVVDRYGDYLVLQALSQGTDRLLPKITAMLVELMAPKGILARNDPRVRLLEGLEQKVDLLYGDVPAAIEVKEGHVTYAVDPFHGQKTGLFLDQRENRAATAQYASGRLLDAFSYNGGFALALAPRCQEVVAVDISEEAVARIRVNAERNALTNVQARAMNVFDELRELERRGDRFDTIVLDPPAFAKNKAAVAKALSGYKEINLRALKLLQPGGYLVTCSCSYNVSESAFADVIASAAADAHVDAAVVEKRMQGRDHPVLMTVPETYYLKCFILRKLA